MTIVLDGSAGITNDGGYTGDGVVFADTTPANTLVTTTGGNVGIGTSSPVYKLDVASSLGLMANFVESASGSTRRIRFSNTGTLNTIESTAGFGSTQLAFAVDGAERARIDSSGNLTLAGSGIMYFGNTSQFIRSAGGAGTQIIVGASNGGFYQQVGGSYYLVTTAGGSTSDETLKKNMQPIENALAKVCAISGITYEFIGEPMCDADKGQQIGVGAQTVEAQFPEIVLTQEDGKKTVRYDRLVAPLIEAIKEQQAIITALTARVTALEGTQP